jgi:hypothetical protein
MAAASMTLAENVNRIDIYTNTLDSARGKLLCLVDRERRKHGRRRIDARTFQSGGTS